MALGTCSELLSRVLIGSLLLVRFFGLDTGFPQS